MNPTQQVDITFNTLALRPLVKRIFLSCSLFVFSVFSVSSFAASCCGGGASSGVILPKFNDAMWDISVSTETYDGFWTQQREYQSDPAGSDLSQNRLTFSYAHRLAEQLQVNVSIPLVDNQTQYSGESSSVQGLGDTSIGLWYETFERVTCVYKITGWESLKPSIYFGTTLTIPTGISPYSDRIDSSFDITGRGFYRWDANAIIEKTVYPFSLGWQGSYGIAMKRPVNQEYGQVVTPYNKQLGNRATSVFLSSYTWFLPDLAMLTATLSHAYLKEEQTEYDGIADSSSGFDKKTNGLSLAYNSSLRDWIIKLSFSKADSGHNYPKTQVVSMGVSHVY